VEATEVEARESVVVIETDDAHVLHIIAHVENTKR
jgi:hypothetical protein